MDAPFSSNKRVFPSSLTAQCSGVEPRPLRALTSAPAFSRICSISWVPNAAAWCNRVEPPLYPSKFELDAEMLCIKVTTKAGDQFTAFYVYVNANLPAGLPLAATGVSLYGFAGLFGQNV